MKCLILMLAGISGWLHATEIREELVVHAGTKFRVVRVSPEALRVVWKDEKGQPYRTFDRVQVHFAKEGKTVKLLMNAGIFEPGGIPTGLHVQDGHLLHPLNTAEGKGNFYLKPNGVLTGLVQTSEKFQAEQKRLAMTASYSLRLAVQSGPMLLIDGARHPAFKEDSPNKLVRNGVGVDRKGRLVLAITAPGQTVNFWDFAGLFLALDCQSALFLDGTISQMTVNPTQPVESNQFGAMLVVAE